MARKQGTGRVKVEFWVEVHDDDVVHLVNRQLDLHIHVRETPGLGQPAPAGRLRAMVEPSASMSHPDPWDPEHGKFVSQPGDIVWLEKPSVTEIRSEDEFWAWQDANPDAYFVNHSRKGERWLHRATCTHFPHRNMSSSLSLPKFVSGSRGDLEAVHQPTDLCHCLTDVHAAE